MSKPKKKAKVVELNRTPPVFEMAQLNAEQGELHKNKLRAAGKAAGLEQKIGELAAMLSEGQTEKNKSIQEMIQKLGVVKEQTVAAHFEFEGRMVAIEEVKKLSQEMQDGFV